MTPKRPVDWSLRLFRSLASAYPHEFRNIYGDEMVRMAEDAVEPSGVSMAFAVCCACWPTSPCASPSSMRASLRRMSATVFGCCARLPASPRWPWFR